MDDLSPREEDILAGVRNDGMIPFPQGAARAIEQTFRILQNLAARGYVRYEKNINWYRAYWLTEKGRRIARAIRVVHYRRLPCARQLG